MYTRLGMTRDGRIHKAGFGTHYNYTSLSPISYYDLGYSAPACSLNEAQALGSSTSCRSNDELGFETLHR